MTVNLKMSDAKMEGGEEMAIGKRVGSNMSYRAFELLSGAVGQQMRQEQKHSTKRVGGGGSQDNSATLTWNWTQQTSESLL